MSDFDQYSSLEKREEGNGGWGLSHDDIVITFHGKDVCNHEIKSYSKVENDLILLEE